MTVASVVHSLEPALSFDADVLVLGVSKEEDGIRLHGAGDGFAGLHATLVAVGVTGAEDEVRRVPFVDASATSIATVGLGSGPIDANLLRKAAGSAIRQLTGATRVALALPSSSDAELIAVLEGAAIGSYSFTSYRSGTPDPAKLPASTITVLSSTQPTTDAVGRANAVGRAVNTVRDLVNTPPSALYPESFAQAAVDLAANTPATVTVLGADDLAAGGFGGIIGVGQGSTRGPRLVKVEYAPADATRHLALVGKGITFDSGGLSLKSPASMVGMKYDMTGAATVLAAILAVAELGLPVRMTAWLCLAENLPSGSAIRPNDVLVIRGGKTVEVLNTDAEGRLVLADGLVAASEEDPDAIVDVATLTGAARVALGDRYVGAMGQEELVSQLVAVAGDVGETFWPMPLPAELRQLLSSDVADITNVKIGSTAAGMLIAGVFLQEFVGTTPEGSKIPWAHLDIAGPASNDGPGYGYTGKGPTAVAVRTLLGLAEQFSRP